MTDSDVNERIRKACRALRISSGMADRAFSTEGKNNQEYLLDLLESEVEERQKQRIKRNIEAAGFPFRPVFDEFDPSEIIFPEDQNYEQIRRLEFLTEHRNIIMYGNTGAGKTMLSILLGTEACLKGYTVQFYRTTNLINQMTEHKAVNRLSILHKKLSRAQILILDEFGYIPYDIIGSQLLFDYLSEIHQKKIIILNTNKEFSKWSGVFYDVDMAAAMIGRLTENCHILMFPGRDRRLEKARQVRNT